jgi:integrase
LKTLKSAADGKRYDIMDALVPGFGIRVTDKGQRSFILIARYPGYTSPARRRLGEYGALTLEAAREKARAWIELVHKGIDPALVEERAKAEAMRKQKNTFAAVAEDWFKDKLPAERKGKEVERDVRKEFMPVWGKRPITDITDLDVLSIINAKKRTAPSQARNLLGHIKRLFLWAMDQRCYGLAASPCDRLRATKIIGNRTRGERILSDDELLALWRAASRMPYPHGPVYQILMLTALRLNEVADARKNEFDWKNNLWTIPAERMKGKNGKAQAHVVPLTDDLQAVLKALPQFKKGPYLFSTNFGEKPAWMSDWIKKRTDQQMLLTLRDLAVQGGDDPDAVELKRWTNHDIRRTVRSKLSRLKIAEEVREAVLGHARPGIKGTYDLYDYLDEKREALQLWAARLRSIVEPAPDNVVTLRA